MAGYYSIYGNDYTRLHIRSTGKRQIMKSSTIFLYFHSNFLPTDNVFDGKADF